MKKLVLSVALFSLLAGSAQAGVILTTSNPPGMPLIMSAGTTSGSMLVSVASDNPLNDVMAGWQFQLEIIPEAGAVGALTFQDPSTGTPSNPPNYIFSNGLGIAVTNEGSHLEANDFFDINFGPGTPVSGAPGANLLQMDFLASSNASGLFGIYARQGDPNTLWTDSSFTTQFFTNVPDDQSDTGLVLIGEVFVTGGVPQAVPEPSSLTLLGMGGVTLAGWRWWRRRKQAAV